MRTDDHLGRAILGSAILSLCACGAGSDANVAAAPSEPAAVMTVPPPAPPTASADAPPEPRPDRTRRRVKTTSFEVQEGSLRLPGPIVFVTGSDKINPVSDPVLEVVKDYLFTKPEITLLRIEGHTDSDGNAAANQTLSEKRSLSVARWLVAQGVDCRRLVPVGFGPTKPIAPNDTQENKVLNRRVAFVNAALQGRPIGGMPVDGGGKVSGDPCK